MITGVMIAALTAVATAAGATVVPTLAPPAVTPKYQPPPPPEAVEPSSTPTPTAAPTPSQTPTPPPADSRRPANAFGIWARPLVKPLAIPQNVLEAYGYAEWVLGQTRATCKLQWTTLAAIGKVASDHGRVDGRTVDEQGWPRPALVGPALDGTGGRGRVSDTDGGALDGDQNWDRAMGPMQLIPSMWRASGVDGDGDNLANPQDIDDAALAAGYHLCASGKDLSVVANWKAAINSYYGMGTNIDRIFDAAHSYGILSKNQRYPERQR